MIRFIVSMTIVFTALSMDQDFHGSKKMSPQKKYLKYVQGGTELILAAPVGVGIFTGSMISGLHLMDLLEKTRIPGKPFLSYSLYAACLSTGFIGGFFSTVGIVGQGLEDWRSAYHGIDHVIQKK